MVVTLKTTLPSDEELTVPEVNLSSSALRAGAFHLGKACEFQNNEFMLCRQELNDPRKCIEEGKAVTNCALNFFRQVKASCAEEFMQYANCIDKSSGKQQFSLCRTTQGVFDKCMKDKMGLDREDYGYFCRARIHHSNRPAPPPKEKVVYGDATPKLPDDFERKPAKYGSRFHWLE
ncbi:NADH dehydrogenase [ubiquinone] 1 alpha subcomplex subunit 8 [Condylostylus longicornis]|uniref:NADH dehydrogenase [ubiquinone] 1 alpha subcomplex subunit 8 n=1 Tax=Condylostylus longicornis TaxID=2530218 RepID=UPI00244E1649|nr:NADH dehydrogenase [ubiquinone] 1 alpha subcomplex subunit 8 [Condylostylus longicornis]